MKKPQTNHGPIVRILWINAYLLLVIGGCLVVWVAKFSATSPSAEASPATALINTNLTVTVPLTVTEQSLRVDVRKTESFSSTRTVVNRLALPSNLESPASTPSAADAESSALDARPLAGGGSPVVKSFSGIAGRVLLTGTPPVREAVDLRACPACAVMQKEPLKMPGISVGRDGGLADVFVSLAPEMFKNRYSAPQIPHRLNLVNCQILPFTSVIWPGQELEFLNQDPVTHVLRLHPAPVASGPIAVAPGSRGVFAWERPPGNFFGVSCDEHPWEMGEFLVTDHPFATITDTNGYFSIPNVPPGRYSVRAAHLFANGTNTIRQEVVVEVGKVAQMNFAFAAPSR